MPASKIQLIASQMLRAADAFACDLYLTTPLVRAEPPMAEAQLAHFIKKRGYENLSARDAAALTFRMVLAVLKTQKLEDGFEVEIDDDAILAPAESHKPMKGAA